MRISPSKGLFFAVNSLLVTALAYALAIYIDKRSRNCKNSKPLKRGSRIRTIIIKYPLLIALVITGMLVCSGYTQIDYRSIAGVWPLDEGRDDTTKDVSGNGHNGKLLGNVKWVDGKFGKALEFPGASGSFVSIPDEEGLNLVTWSVTAWIKVEEVKGAECHVVIKEEPGNTRNYGIIVKPEFAYPTFTAGPAIWKNVAGKTP